MNLRAFALTIAAACGSGCADAQYKSEATTSLSAPSEAFRDGSVTFNSSYGASKSAPASTPPATFAMERGNLEISREERDRVPIDDPAAKPVERKILYTADVQLVVEDFPRAADAIVDLVKRSGGYVADTDSAGAPGRNRSASWKVRIPVDRFESFLEDVVKLGELQRKQLHSQDVTEEFFDLETRVKNKKVEESRLVKHLTDSTGKLEDILAVEREISRVREEVERMEGRVRLLANLAALTTVDIRVHERLGYTPATAPTFGTRAERRLAGSAKRLTDWLQAVALDAISVVPWLPVWLVVGLLAWIFRRALLRFARWFASLVRPRRAAAP